MFDSLVRILWKCPIDSITYMVVYARSKVSLKWFYLLKKHNVPHIRRLRLDQMCPRYMSSTARTLYSTVLEAVHTVCWRYFFLAPTAYNWPNLPARMKDVHNSSCESGTVINFLHFFPDGSKFNCCQFVVGNWKRGSKKCLARLPNEQPETKIYRRQSNKLSFPSGSTKSNKQAHTWIIIIVYYLSVNKQQKIETQ